MLNEPWFWRAFFVLLVVLALLQRWTGYQFPHWVQIVAWTLVVENVARQYWRHRHEVFSRRSTRFRRSV